MDKILSLIVLLSSFSFISCLQFNNATTETFLGASKGCLNAVNADIACNGLLRLARSGSNQQYQTKDLANLCTTGCFNSLKSHRAAVASACGSTQYFDEPTESYYSSTLLDDELLYAFNSTCITSPSTGQYCTTWFQGVRNGTQIPTNPNCNDCVLKTFQFQLGSPFGDANAAVSSQYSSLTSSCRSTQFPPGTPTSLVLSTPAPTVRPTCTGVVYTLKSGDTANSVAKAQSVSTESLLERNGLSANTTGFPQSGQLCAEGTCKIYTIKANDTCQSIGSQTNATYAQLLSWNGNINWQCTNLASFVNWAICVSNPRGDFTMPINPNSAPDVATTAAPVPTPVAPNTNSKCGKYYMVAANDDCQTVSLKFTIPLKDFFFLNPQLWTNCTNLWLDTYYCVQAVGTVSTYPGYPGATTTAPIVPDVATSLPISSVKPLPNAQPIIPMANKTRLDCSDYVWLKSTSNTSLANCWRLAGAYDSPREDFILWNPSLDKTPTTGNKTYDYPCTLSASSSYCVKLSRETSVPSFKSPTPRAAGEVANCTTWAEASAEVGCASILDLYGLTIDQFFGYNPSAKSDCSGLAAGTFYCISDGKPLAEVSTTSASSTTSSRSTTTSKTTSTSSTGIATPTPIQAGMVTNCNKFYFVDIPSCFDIAAKSGITLAQLYAWNPALNNDCSGLWGSYYVCIGVTSASSSSTRSSTSTRTTTSAVAVATPTPIAANMAAGCKSFHYVVSGDDCSKISVKYSITLANFVAWNPDVGTTTACTVWSNYWYCIGH